VTVTEFEADWLERNQQALMREVTCVRATLERYIRHTVGPVCAEDDLIQSGSAALDLVCTRFGLSTFERKIVLLCAAPELDGSFRETLAVAQNDPARAFPTFGLALAAFTDAHWSALSPNAPLRHWRLIEGVDGASGVTSAPLRLDEWLLHVLTGTAGLDPRLAPFLAPVAPIAQLPATQLDAVAQMLNLWTDRHQKGTYVPIQLFGTSVLSKRDVLAAAAEKLNCLAYIIEANDLPPAAAECEQLVRLWEREAAIRPSVLLIDAQETVEPAASAGLPRFVDRVSAPVALMTRGPSRVGHRPTLALEILKPTREEQRGIWFGALDPETAALDRQVDTVVTQFAMDRADILAAAVQVRGGQNIWDVCRRASRTSLDELAQRMDPFASFEDLVVSNAQRESLDDIVAHTRQRVRVFDDWGMAGPSQRGLGTTALFAGPSGTGKTLAAEVIAHALRLDLYRIDLSQVVSKYIGETEKNLRRVFDAADEGGAVLLFDEADALFGKRSEVRDSHDRYANIEVSYLLQRMEGYRGLAILTTNMRSAIDPAFMRRLRFVVSFPFPDLAQREQLWRKAFPEATPTYGVDFAKLARLAVAGGSIRNIALYAAFLAAERGEPVGMHHLLRAAASECAKLERSPTEKEIGGWV
jgi:ATP-dependent 26S proteasome regulatory subunit